MQQRRGHAWIALAAVGGAATILACGVADLGRPDASAMRAGIEAALAEPETLARTAALVTLLQRLDEENVAGAAAAYDARLSVVEDEDLRLLLHAWAALDPRAALDHTQAWTMLAKRELGAGQVIHYWAWHGGADDALFYAESLAEPSVRRVALRELVSGWSRSGDVEGITAFVSGLNHGDLRDRYTAILVEGIVAREGVDAAMAWAESLPDDAHEKFKRTAFRKTLRHVTARDPERAARWYQAHAGQPYSDLGMPVVATEWVEQEPEAAFAWLAAQAPDPQRDMAVRFAMKRWLELDPAAAGAWMRSGAWDPLLSPALEPFAIWLLRSDPAEAVVFSERIPDEAKRARMLTLAGSRWRRQDEAAFEAWLADAELPEATREALETRTDRPGRSGTARSAKAGENGE